MGQYVCEAIANVNRGKGKPSTYPKQPYLEKANQSTLKKKWTKEETEQWLARNEAK